MKVDKDLYKNWERIEIALFLHSQKQDDSVAQLVEHDTFNVGVLGSSPSGITKAKPQSGRLRFFYFHAFRFAGSISRLATAYIRNIHVV